ncbi:hypothetical protein B0T19DRAFT_119998 [Cercophora scortea]|uniref:Transmembrane protein n=1 Tax=Cercophora scortea TaxID=314031 RepID=A0AAE0IXV6_9PEZI|nr:hypothetical protein B0T19DRAFT_119998 [Cercophora scortea]
MCGYILYDSSGCHLDAVDDGRTRFELSNGGSPDVFSMHPMPMVFVLVFHRQLFFFFLPGRAFLLQPARLHCVCIVFSPFALEARASICLLSLAFFWVGLFGSFLRPLRWKIPISASSSFFDLFGCYQGFFVASGWGCLRPPNVVVVIVVVVAVVLSMQLAFCFRGVLWRHSGRGVTFCS